MAKKAAKKKVAKKVGKIAKTVEDEAIENVIDDLSTDEAIEMIDAAGITGPAQIEAVGEPDVVRDGEDSVDRTKVRINIPVRLKIKNREMMPGSHIVERHQVASILEMVDKKRKADLSIFTGKNYLVEKLIDRSLRVTEVEQLDLQKLTK
jgi:hypothetical protein